VTLLHPEFTDDPAALSGLKRTLSVTRRQGFGTNFRESERAL
jgi:hypothetical protein